MAGDNEEPMEWQSSEESSFSRPSVRALCEAMKRLSLSETSDDTSSFCIPHLSTPPSADRNRPDDDEIPMDWQQCGRDRDNPNDGLF